MILTSISAKCQNEYVVDEKLKETLIEDLIKNSKSGVTIKLDNGSQTYTAYKICENQNLEIQKLNKLISNQELDELFLSKNSALKCVAFIIFANRNNNKEILLKKLNDFFAESYQSILPNCSDMPKSKNIFKFCAGLLTYPNVFFRPTFNLSDLEKVDLLRNGFKYENKME